MTLLVRHEDAEDLFQQTSVTLWQQRGKYDPSAGQFSSWACAIAHNHVRNFRRTEKTRRNILSAEIERMLIDSSAVHASLMDEWHAALGTEFGVSVSPNGESRVQVYDGKVRAESSGSDQKELGAGETLLCSSDDVMRPAQFSENRFIRTFPPSEVDRLGGPLYTRIS